MDLSLERENRLVLDIVQAALGLISPDMRAISVRRDSSQITLYIAVRERNAEVEEDIEDMVFELQALQDGPAAIQVVVFVGAPNGDWPGASCRGIYMAKPAGN